MCPSIVLGARWPNGITTARAVAAAPVRPRGKGNGGALACVRAYVCVFTNAFGVLSSRTARDEVQTLKLMRKVMQSQNQKGGQATKLS